MNPSFILQRRLFIFLGSFPIFLKSQILDTVLRLLIDVSVHRIYFVRREARRVNWISISTGMSSLQVLVLGLMGAPILFALLSLAIGAFLSQSWMVEAGVLVPLLAWLLDTLMVFLFRNPVVLEVTGLPFLLETWSLQAHLALLVGNAPVLKVTGALTQLELLMFEAWECFLLCF